MDEPERTRVLSLLREHGWNSTSFQVLEPGRLYHFDGEACVAYVDTGSAWVAAAAPIAAPERLRDVALGFVNAARAAHRRPVFFATEGRFTDAVPELSSLQIGEQPVWDPLEWDDTLARSSSLRQQLRRAQNKGVTVRCVAPEALLTADSSVRLAIERLVSRWLGGRPMAPMGFLVDVELFAFAPERRYFVAELAGEVIGALVAVPVYARHGWFFEDFVRDETAPNGTSELLIDAAMRSAKQEGARYVTLGLAPLAGSVPAPLRFARAASRMLYDFRGLRAFKEKLGPTRWEPIFLSHPHDIASTTALLDVLAAFARGSFMRFGLETLLRGPAFVVRVLAGLLVPWTIGLATLDWSRWLEPKWMRDAFVVFDVGLIVGLFVLAARWRRWLGVTLAWLVTVDACTTVLGAILVDASRIRGARDALVLVIACVAPSVAAWILWGAVGHRAKLVP